MAETVSIDDELSPDGRVMEVLSEHCCQGWLEGYLLTGRHGMWSSYEAFAQVVDSMLTQHAKWLEQCRDFPWRRPLASLNVLLTSHAWRNDHNGFSHQATGFVDNALARRSETIRVYYPPDSNCLLSVFDHCLRSRNYVNIVTCGKQPQLQWLNMDEALEHCSRGASIWKFATNDGGGEPDVVLACAGDVPTIETCAASWLLQKYVPGIKVRVVNVVDLSILMSPDDHPHGMDNMSFNALFTKDAPVIFAFHNNRWLIHTMVHGRSNESRFHVRGYMDQGTTTTPFDMVVLNKMSRFHLAIDALKYVSRLRSEVSDIVDTFNRKLYEHHDYIRQHLEDMPEIRNWQWTADFSDPSAPRHLPRDILELVCSAIANWSDQLMRKREGEGAIADGIGTRQNARRSTQTRILGRGPVDLSVGHHFWPERSSAGRGDKQGGDLVEFRFVLRNALSYDDLVFSGISSRPALHQCLRRARKLRAMPHPLRLQPCDGDGVRELLLYKADR